MRQQGFSLISAIFLLVVLAALGGYMATLSGTQHTSGMLSVLGTRAHFAARSGIEWATADIVNNGASSLSCPGTVSFGLDGHALAVDCANQPGIVEGAAPPYTVYNLTVTASRGSLGDHGFVSRQVLATVVFP